MKAKLIEKNTLPLVKYETDSGEHFALLDTGSDNTITYFTEEAETKTNATIVGFGGSRDSSARVSNIDFTIDGQAFQCEGVIVSKEFFDVFYENGMPEVEMILGTNFFNKYKAKIDFENMVLIV